VGGAITTRSARRKSAGSDTITSAHGASATAAIELAGEH